MAPRLSCGGSWIVLVLSLTSISLLEHPVASLRSRNSSSELYNHHLRHLQVTGALDWPPSPRANNSNDNPPQAQRTQEGTVPDTIPPVVTATESESGTFTPKGNTNLGVVDNNAQPKGQKSRFTLGTIVFLGVVLAVVSFFVLVIKRRQELARWREYRTHQILRAQDEAFDTTYDEAFDLELVEGSTSTGLIA
jgi:hypothetical protein